MLPGFDGRNRAFFFVNYEELREPGGTRRTRTILSPSAQQGVFRYNTTSGVQSVNLFELAARQGQTATPDPFIAQLLADIRSATGREGNVRDLTDPLFQEYSFQIPTQAMNRYPTVRVDYQLTDRHRLTYSMNFQYIGGGPDTTNNRDPQFSRLPGVRQSDLGAARGQRLAALDDRHEHGQRVPLRLRRRADDLLAGSSSRRTCSPAASPIRAAST